MSSRRGVFRNVSGNNFLPISVPQVEKVSMSPYPFFAGVALLVFLTLWGGISYDHVFQGAWQYIVSFGSTLSWNASGVLEIGLIVAAVIVLDITFAIPLGLISLLVAGGIKNRNKLDKIQEKIGHSTSRWFIVILCEELFARFLFMGVLAVFLPGSMFLWGVIGNALWALLHLVNYHPEDRHIARVLPQFVGGFFLMAVYAHFGFWWVVVCHFSYDAMLFAMAKRKEGLKEDLLHALYWGLVAAASGFLFFQNAHVLEILNGWLAGEFVRIESAGFWDYFLVFVAIGAFSELALSIAGYDIRGIRKKEVTGIHHLLMGAPLMIGLVFFGVMAGQWLDASYLSIVLAMTIFFTVLAPVDTLSALSRVWFDGLVSNFLLVSAIITLGFWEGLLLFVAYYPVALIPMVLKREAGKFSYGNGQGV